MAHDATFKITDEQAVYFWSKVATDSDCWVWCGCFDKDGYGKIRLSSRDLRSHRVSYCLDRKVELESISGFFICHKCDNPKCVRPDHLFLGTPKENIADSIAKKRRNAPHGANHWASKITESDVLEIRKMIDEGRSQPEIGALFGVGQSVISRIKSRQTWAHV